MEKLFLLVMAMVFTMPFFTGHTAEAAAKGRILLVASSQQTMALKNGTKMDVGFYLNELAVPAQYLAKQGYEIIMATPSGARPVMDASSNSAKFFGGSEAERAQAQAFTEKLPVISLKKANEELAHFDAIFIPGGHAPMTDLMQDEELGTALRYFHKQNKPTAAICHGPVALLAALPQAASFRQTIAADDVKGAQLASKDWIYEGYQMTMLSDLEEWPGELHKGTQMPFHIEQALQMAGGTIVNAGMYKSYVIRDRELITGENPQSDLALAKALDEALQKK